MILIANNITLSYSDKTLLNNIFLSITKKDKLGLIGINGSGKSTLLSILSKEIESEYGSVEFISDSKISYMKQVVSLDLNSTILEYINSCSKNIKEFEFEGLLTKLNITNLDEKISNLSYGTKRKIALAQTLATESNLLILDEPTNHLDSNIIEWLEKYLIQTNKAVLLVTHDRYFLERVCNGIIELDEGSLYKYSANYSLYLELKNQKEEYEKAKNRKLKAFLKREYEWYQRGAIARVTKDKRRIENYEELSSIKQKQNKSLIIESISTRMGSKTIELNDISFKNLFKNFSYMFNKEDRIGIIGPNGCGKSTLLNIINKSLNPTTGEVIIGDTICISYFKQENYELDEDLRIIDYIKNISLVIKTKKGVISPTTILERFLFDDPYVKINKLSGGEKRRLYLLGILIKSPNVLLLDEPTNDLDITTLSILEEYLEEFLGIVIIVSHDRYFIDNCCDVLFVFENNSINIYNGNYSYYQENKKETVKKVVENKPKKTNLNKLTYNEAKELNSLFEEISLLEEEIKDLESKTVLNTNYEEVNNIYKLIKTKNDILEEKIKRWEYLESKEQK